MNTVQLYELPFLNKVINITMFTHEIYTHSCIYALISTFTIRHKISNIYTPHNVLSHFERKRKREKEIMKEGKEGRKKERKEGKKRRMRKPPWLME